MNADERGSVSYTLDELLAQCDVTAPMTTQEREWLDGDAVGRELA